MVIVVIVVVRVLVAVTITSHFSSQNKIITEPLFIREGEWREEGGEKKRERRGEVIDSLLNRKEMTIRWEEKGKTGLYKYTNNTQRQILTYIHRDQITLEVFEELYQKVLFCFVLFLWLWLWLNLMFLLC